jgi:ubiquitin carboxyl-terminal hydrolase 47
MMLPRAEEEAKFKYVGLANQGATCYMNSLLQALYHTQEFRKELFKWRYNDKQHQKAEDSIPLQLQRIFAQMQLRVAPYVDAKGLIRSFQWDTIESFEQHDVQEFCRVLFTAIEESVIGSTEGDPDFISKLYEGCLGAYIQCLTCKTISTREENFRDLQLILHNDYQKIRNTSVEMALDNFFTPEKLEGDNMYFCSHCQHKVNALKYYKLVKVPSILCLQLNRFTYNAQTYTKIKLNDRMSFPLTLNVNFYLK